MMLRRTILVLSLTLGLGLHAQENKQNSVDSNSIKTAAATVVGTLSLLYGTYKGKGPHLAAAASVAIGSLFVYKNRSQLFNDQARNSSIGKSRISHSNADKTRPYPIRKI